MHSTRNVKLPAKIGLTKCLIETEVVKVDIPLLLSKMSLKKAGTILDMEKDSAVMFKQSIPLEFISSGHYMKFRNVVYKLGSGGARQILSLINTGVHNLGNQPSDINTAVLPPSS